MSRIYVPSSGTSDWQKLLADPVKQWKPGYSAQETAKAWEAADGFPPCIAEVFQKAEEPLPSLVPLIILPEHHVPLDGGSQGSQNDVWVLASHAFGLASIAVEGKVTEDFDVTVGDWLIGASSGKIDRLNFLVDILGLDRKPLAATRYQLLHRFGSAVIEAKRFHANIAICVVQSFSKSHENLSDFQAFCGLFGQHPQPGDVVNLNHHHGITLYAVWVSCS